MSKVKFMSEGGSATINQEEELNLYNQQQALDDEESHDQIILLTCKLLRMIQRRDQQNFFSTNKDEKANLCLMAKSDNEEVNPEPCSSCEKTEFLFDNLFYNSLILEQTCESLRNENLELKREKENLEKINKDLLKNIQDSQSKEVFEIKSESQEENIVLKKNVLQLKNDISNFVKSTETFQKIMGSQVSVFDKACIGFKTNHKQKLYENFFIPEKVTKRSERYKCTYCEKYGHLEPFCFRKKKEQALQKTRVTFKSNFVRFHKEGFPKSNTNHQGPKKIWVPKALLTSTAGMSHDSQEKALVLGQWMLKTYDWR